MEFHCRACGCDHSTSDEECHDAEMVLPKGWYIRSIDERDYVLCDVCGNIRQFKGGISAYLMDRLGLDAEARCDLSDEVNTLGHIRRRKKRTWTFG